MSKSAISPRQNDAKNPAKALQTQGFWTNCGGRGGIRTHLKSRKNVAIAKFLILVSVFVSKLQKDYIGLFSKNEIITAK